MNLADLLKKNIVMVPVVASLLVGTFTGVKYIVNLTDTINGNRACLLYTSPSPRDRQKSRMPSSA